MLERGLVFSGSPQKKLRPYGPKLHNYMNTYDRIYNLLTEGRRTASQAQSQATAISKLSRALPPTPPSSERVTPKQRYGTKEHYVARARRLSSLAAGLRRPKPVSLETTNTLQRLKDRAGIKDK